ncbi:MAG: hypothetical protein KDD41_00565 [Flavobacteriales bacterium]|nr:hypothetical protein [Flavobacteriales bacterium]
MERQSSYHKLKIILAVALLLVMFVPLAQQRIHFVEEEDLYGVFDTPKNPDVTWATWFDGSFQKEQEEHVKFKIGFKSWFVRLHNQLEFSLFDQANADEVIVGKENFLYQERYILTCFGEDAVDSNLVTYQLNRLEQISDSLEQIGKHVIFIIAPGKGSFYPEYFPDQYQSRLRKKSNYDLFAAALPKRDIHYLDLNAWFMRMKGKTTFPIMSKTGIHWSDYGAMLAADTITKYIAKVSGAPMPKIHIDAPVAADYVAFNDKDIEMGMNLLFDIEDLTMAYPYFEIVKDSLADTVQVLTIGDSFYWQLYHSGMSSKAFNQGEFWYYNQQVYVNHIDTIAQVAINDYARQVLKNDVVLVVATDANLGQMGYGFIDLMWKDLFEKEK